MAWPISAALAESLRVGGAFRPVLAVLSASGAPTDLDLQVLSGQVEVSSGSGARRRLTCEVAPSPGLWGALAPRGVRVAAYWEAVALNQRVPLGVFEVDSQSVSHGTEGGIRITAPDLWQSVARARFLRPRTTIAGNAVGEAMRLVEEVTGVAPSVVGAPTGETIGATWPRDRGAAVLELVKAAGYEVGFDAQGACVARPVPGISGRGVFTVDAGHPHAVLLAAERSRSRQNARSAVVVTPTYVDGRPLYDPVVVRDEDPSSPTFVDGPFGFVPAFFDTELIGTPEQALVAGRGLLQRVRGLGSTLELTSAPNPALDGGDTIAVRTPARGGAGGGAERHVLDKTTIDLVPGGGQRIAVRDTGPGEAPDGVV